MAKPGTYSPTFVQGDDWSFPATLKDQAGAAIDLTGYTFLAQARTRASAGVAFTLTVTVTDAANGVVTVTVDAATTADIGPGTYVWDLQWTDAAGDIRTILAGTITVLPEVSRP